MFNKSTKAEVMSSDWRIANVVSLMMNGENPSKHLETHEPDLGSMQGFQPNFKGQI